MIVFLVLVVVAFAALYLAGNAQFPLDGYFSCFALGVLVTLFLLVWTGVAR